MLSDSGKNISIWMATTPTLTTAPLAQDAHADVCVVGAGIAGLTTAYLLAREGRSVIVLDDGPLGGGETSRTTGHLASGVDDRFSRLEQLHGKDGARLTAESHAAAIRVIEETVRAEGIDCDFRRVDGYLFVPPGESTKQLERELEAAHRAGLTGAEMVDRPPYDGYDFGAALRFPEQGQFHVMKYLRGLSDALSRLGGQVFTGSHVEKVANGKPVKVTVAGGHTVTCEAAVVATNSPVNDFVAMHTKQAAYRTYVIAAQIPRGVVPEVLMWDTPDPYHYVRVCSVTAGWPAGLEDSDLLLVGGEDHKTGQAEDFDAPYRRLEQWTRERFPMVRRIALRWSGQVLEPVDSLAFIGRNPLNRDHIFIATGDSGNGLTHGTIAGMLITDLIQERNNPWERLYSPSRKTLRAGATFARENLNVVAQFAELATAGEVESTAAIAPGEGAVVRQGLKKIAAYRDADGTLHQRSAFCTHLGCVVAWNATEQTWDCPCHGSRFDKLDGHPLNGPALNALHEVDEEPGATPELPGRTGERDAPRARE